MRRNDLVLRSERHLEKSSCRRRKGTSMILDANFSQALMCMTLLPLLGNRDSCCFFPASRIGVRINKLSSGCDPRQNMKIILKDIGGVSI